MLRAGSLEHLLRPLVAPTWYALLVSATLAGWLMGLLSWLLVASRETVSQILFVYVTTFAIGVAHLQHIVSGAVLSFMGLFAGVVTVREALHFAAWTTVGNSIGGIAFALLVRFSILKRADDPHPDRS